MKYKGKSYLTVKETAAKLEVCIATLYKIIGDGAFTGPGDTFMLRGRRLFSEESIEKYIESQIEMSL